MTDDRRSYAVGPLIGWVSAAQPTEFWWVALRLPTLSGRPFPRHSEAQSVNCVTPRPMTDRGTKTNDAGIDYPWLFSVIGHQTSVVPSDPGENESALGMRPVKP